MAWQRARQNYQSRAYFDSKDQGDYKAKVALFARDGLKKMVLPLLCSVTLDVACYFTRPKARCGKNDCRDAIIMPKRPDGDNLLKMVGDALNGIVWKDDGQIVDGRVRKFYHEIGGAPRTEITIAEAVEK